MILLLAGPPAVGHNTVAELLARDRDRVAILDGDDLRTLLVSPTVPPDGGPEWNRQYVLSVRNLCAVARNFAADGVDVIVADVVEPAVLPLFRELLADAGRLVVVLLIADPDVLVARDIARDPNPSADPSGLAAWHDRICHLQRQLLDRSGLYDHVVDSSAQTPAETAEAVRRLLPTSTRSSVGPGGAPAGSAQS